MCLPIPFEDALSAGEWQVTDFASVISFAARLDGRIRERIVTTTAAKRIFLDASASIIMPLLYQIMFLQNYIMLCANVKKWVWRIRASMNMSDCRSEPKRSGHC